MEGFYKLQVESIDDDAGAASSSCVNAEGAGVLDHPYDNAVRIVVVSVAEDFSKSQEYVEQLIRLFAGEDSEYAGEILNRRPEMAFMEGKWLVREWRVQTGGAAGGAMFIFYECYYADLSIVQEGLISSTALLRRFIQEHVTARNRSSSEHKDSRKFLFPAIIWAVTEGNWEAGYKDYLLDNMLKDDKELIPIIALRFVTRSKRIREIMIVDCITAGEYCIRDGRYLNPSITAQSARSQQQVIYGQSFTAEGQSSSRFAATMRSQFAEENAVQGLTELLQLTKHILQDGSLQCAWDVWHLPSLRLMLRRSAVIEAANADYFTKSAEIMANTWSFPLRQKAIMIHEFGQFATEWGYTHSMEYRLVLLMGAILWIKWNYINNNLREFDDAKKIRRQLEDFIMSPFGQQVKQFLHSNRLVVGKQAMIVDFYYNTVSTKGIHGSPNAKFNNHKISLEQKLLERSFKSVAEISVNRLTSQAEDIIVIARYKGGDAMEFVFQDAQAMSICVGVGLKNARVLLDLRTNAVLIREQQSIPWSDELGEAVNCVQGQAFFVQIYKVFAHSRTNSVHSHINTFVENVKIITKLHGKMTVVHAFKYKTEPPIARYTGIKPLLHLLCEFVLSKLPLVMSESMKTQNEASLLGSWLKRMRGVSAGGGGGGGGKGGASSSGKNDGGGGNGGNGGDGNDGGGNNHGNDGGGGGGGGNDGDGNDGGRSVWEDSHDGGYTYEVMMETLESGGIFEPSDAAVPREIRGQMITPKVCFKFVTGGGARKGGSQRSITITISTKCSQSVEKKVGGSSSLWFHDDIVLSIAADKKEAKLQGEGHVLNERKSNKFKLTNNTTSSRGANGIAATEGSVNVAGVAAVKGSISVSCNTQQTDLQGHEEEYEIQTVCDGFHPICESDDHALKYQLQFPLFSFNLDDARVKKFLMQTSGLASTITPEIQGEWVPLNVARHSPYFFEAMRTWKNDLQSSSTESLIYQRYAIAFFINHGMSNLKVPDIYVSPPLA